MRRVALTLCCLASSCGSAGTGEVAQGSDGAGGDSIGVVIDGQAGTGVLGGQDAASAGDSPTFVAPDSSLPQDAATSWDAVVLMDARTVGVPTGTLDCAWLADDDNCYKRTLAAGGVCLPPSSARKAQ